MTPTKATVPKEPLLGVERSSGRLLGDPPTHGPLPDPVKQKEKTVLKDNPSPTFSDGVNTASPPPPQLTDTKVPSDDGYPNSHFDPDPLAISATVEQKASYKSKINKFGTDTLKVFQELQFTGEEFWIEFISSFRPHSIKLWEPHL